MAHRSPPVVTRPRTSFMGVLILSTAILAAHSVAGSPVLAAPGRVAHSQAPRAGGSSVRSFSRLSKLPAPRSVSATAGDLENRISWLAPFGTSSRRVAGYVIYRSRSSAGPFSVVARVGRAARSYTDPIDTDALGVYSYRVVARDAKGRTGLPSAVVSADRVVISASLDPLSATPVIASTGELVLDVPAGAVLAPTTITITEKDAPGALNSVDRAYTPSYDFGPDGLSFSAAALPRLTLAYAPFFQGATFEEKWVAKTSNLYVFDESAFAWARVTRSMTVDTTAKTVSADISHFSSYADAFLYQPHGTTSSSVNMCTVCHDLHGSLSSAAVRRTAYEACLYCHGAPTPDGDTTATQGPNIAAEFYLASGQTTSGHSYHPVGERKVGCVDCHTPHKDPSAFPKLLYYWAPYSSGSISLSRYYNVAPGAPTPDRFFSTLTPASGQGNKVCLGCHGPFWNKRITRGTGALETAFDNYWLRTGEDHSTDSSGTAGFYAMSAHGSVGNTYSPAASSYGATSSISSVSSEVQCMKCHNDHGRASDGLDSVGRLQSAKVGTQTVSSAGNDFCFTCHLSPTNRYPAHSCDASGYPDHVSADGLRCGGGTWPGKASFDDTSSVESHIGDPHGTTNTVWPSSSNKGGDCKNCHDVHQSRSEANYDFLRARFSSGRGPESNSDAFALCFTCHGTSDNPTGAADIESFYETAAGTNHGHAIRSAAGTLSVGDGLPCYECHQPHGSKNGNRWAISDKRWAGIDPATSDGTASAQDRDSNGVNDNRDFCLGCHVASDDSDATGTVVGLSRQSTSTELKLANVSPHRQASVSSACRTCHGSSYASGGKNVHNPGGHGEAGENCADCHGSTGSHAVHVSTTDPRGPHVTCESCHDSDAFPTMADGGNLTTTSVCDTCHSPGGSYNGVTSTAGSVGAKTNWATKVYETTTTLKSGKEKWCAGCHDGHEGVPGEEPSKVSTVYAPPITGDESSDTPYGTGYGYYKTGHGVATQTAYPASGGFFGGAGLGCGSCHDYERAHIDGSARTYAGGVSDGGTAYRNGYRLKLVGGQEPMNLPRPINLPGGVNNPDDYRMCLQGGCHAQGPFTDAGNRNTNAVADGGATQVHAYHMGTSMNNRPWASSWDGSDDSHYSCTTCHNVHGSKRPAMLTDGRLTGNEPGLWLWYNNDSLVSHYRENEDPIDPVRPVPDSLQLPPSTGVLWIERTTYNIAASCSCHTSSNSYVEPEYRNAMPWWKGPNPALAWTYEPGFVARGVDPQRMLTWGGSVEFRVKYYDKENDPPSYIDVSVDTNDNGSYESSETTALVAADGDSDYTDGKIYTKTLSLGFTGDGAYKFKFSASDGTNVALGAPTLDQTVIVDANHKRDVPAEYPTIQDAIDDSVDGDVVSVADGTYDENITFRGLDITVESVNGPGSTTIQGDGSNAAVVTFGASETAAAVLDGFTLDNTASASMSTRAVYIDDSSPTIRDCVLEGNDVYYSTGAFGGAVLITGPGGGATIQDTVIGGGASDGNSARRGGAIYFTGSTSGTLTIEGSTISYNESTDWEGGALYLSGNTNPTVISDTTITCNTAAQKGGAVYCNNSPVAIFSSHIDANTATGLEGGGLSLAGTTDALISGSTVSGNAANNSGGGVFAWTGVSLTVTASAMDANTTGIQGGGLYFAGSTLSLSKVYVRGNQAATHGGGVFVSASVAASITSCMIGGNRANANDGGGLYVSGSCTVLNSTIAGNRCAAQGGGMLGGSSTVRNSILWGNKTDNTNPTFKNNLSGASSVTYSDIGESGYAGSNGNINTDPLYVSAVAPSEAATTAGDYHIQMYSPCMDTATSTAAAVDDIDETGRPQGAEVDMGADELVVPAGTPYLAWTGDAGYESDGVNPDFGPSGTQFVFRVKYTDTDTPTIMKLWFDADNDDSFEAGEDTTLTAVDPSDTDHTDGKSYQTTLTVSKVGDGNHGYRFEASDGTYQAIGPPTLDQNLPVGAVNNKYVPGQYSTIQAAIDAASPGDHVVVAADTYYENITFRGKAVTVESTGGAALTSIVGTNSPSTVDTAVVTFATGETRDSVLDGFTIDNGHSNGTKSRGIYVANASPTVKNCLVVGNSLTNQLNCDGGGLYVSGGAPLVSETTIGVSGNANTARWGAGAFVTGSGTLEMTGCAVTYNSALQNCGGIYSSGCTLALTNTRVDYNQTGAIGSYDGGGIYMTGASASTTITGGSVSGNQGRYGGGIYVNGSTAARPLVIDGASVDSNTSGNLGGGIYLTTVTNTVTITGSTVSSNAGPNSGVGIYGTGAAIHIEASHVDSNTCSGAGGQNGGGIWNNKSLTVVGSTVSGNRAGQLGGGIYFTSSTGVLSIAGSTISANTVGSSSNGGGIYMVNVTGTSSIATSTISGHTTSNNGGGIYCSAAPLSVSASRIIGNNVTGGGQYAGGIYTNSTLNMVNSDVCGNRAGGGHAGGMYWTGSGELVNCTISGNYAGAGYGDGGGLYGSASGSLKNCIVYGNWSGDQGKQIYPNSPGVTVTYSDVEGGYAGTGNINSSPAFVSSKLYSDSPTSAGDYHIQSSSPCTNTATSTAAPPTDIDGDSRPQGSGYDMGSDEYKPPAGAPARGSWLDAILRLMPDLLATELRSLRFLG